MLLRMSYCLSADRVRYAGDGSTVKAVARLYFLRKGVARCYGNTSPMHVEHRSHLDRIDLMRKSDGESLFRLWVKCYAGFQHARSYMEYLARLHVI